MGTRSTRALLLALALDLAFGDPGNAWHPVAWLGGLIALLRRQAPPGPARRLLLHGGILVALLAGVAASTAALVQRLAAPWPLLGWLAEAWVLKCAFAVRGLFAAVGRVGSHLAGGDLDAARRQAGRDLVSRPTQGLPAGLVAAAAIESLAENLTDSWVAPVLCFALGGLPLAWAYRAVNTADAMIGYRDGALEHLGKAAARLDDLLNWAPARLAALGLVAGAAGAGGSPSGAWRMLRLHGARTASPNAGRTMAAMAGALGVRLEKTSHYVLGEGPEPSVRSIGQARRVAAWAVGLTLASAVVVLEILPR
jgi:adenosylcobinamide-phosphate synthase